LDIPGTRIGKKVPVSGAKGAYPASFADAVKMPAKNGAQWKDLRRFSKKLSSHHDPSSNIPPE